MPPIHTMLLHTTIPTIITVPHHTPMLDTPPRTMSITAIEEPAATPAMTPAVHQALIDHQALTEDQAQVATHHPAPTIEATQVQEVTQATQA